MPIFFVAYSWNPYFWHKLYWPTDFNAMSRSSNFTIFNLLTITTIVAFGCLTLVNQWPWLKSTLVTVLLGFSLHALIASAICRGSKQAFGIGYSIASLFYYLSFYSFYFTEPLPFLLTKKAWEAIQSSSTGQQISEEHFFIVATELWWFVCAYSGGLIGKRYYNQRVASSTGTTQNQP